MLYDILQTSETDFYRVLIFASIGIMVVIIVLLRSLLAPLYMVLTVLFNFGASLGISTFLLREVYNINDLVYLLPVFTFIMLAAVGADYNIFLVSRIREEAERSDMKTAVRAGRDQHRRRHHVLRHHPGRYLRHAGRFPAAGDVRDRHTDRHRRGARYFPGAGAAGAFPGDADRPLGLVAVPPVT